MLVREGRNIVVMSRADERTFGITQKGKEINAVLDCAKAVQDCVKEEGFNTAALSTVDNITFRKDKKDVDEGVRSAVLKMIEKIEPICRKFGTIDHSFDKSALSKEGDLYIQADAGLSKSDDVPEFGFNVLIDKRKVVFAGSISVHSDFVKLGKELSTDRKVSLFKKLGDELLKEFKK